MRPALQILVRAAERWIDDNVFKHSAAVSFYTLFSLAPITVIAVEIVGFFVGGRAANHQLHRQLEELVGSQSAGLIQQTVKSSESIRGDPWAETMGIVLLLVGATSVFGQLQSSLNEIWCVRAKPTRSGWLVLIVQRLVSFAMVVTIGFLLLVSLVVTTVLTGFSHRFSGEWAPAVARAADMLIGLGVVTVMFALIFKVMPDVKLKWRDVWLSALLTAALFTIGRFAIALYLGHSNAASIYGAAGSLAALLIWVYYSCAILFFGVEFNRAYHEVLGRPVYPSDTAVTVRSQVVEDDSDVVRP